MSERVTLERLGECRLLRPNSHAGEFEAGKLAMLQALREAGLQGISTLKFLRSGIGGVRPPNRICDLRKDGHLIRAVHESGWHHRFVLVSENPSHTPRPAPSRVAEQIPISEFIRRRSQEDARAMPLFGARP